MQITVVLITLEQEKTFNHLCLLITTQVELLVNSKNTSVNPLKIYKGKVCKMY